MTPTPKKAAKVAAAGKSAASTSGKPRTVGKVPSFNPAGKSPSMPSRSNKFSSKSNDLTTFNNPKIKSSTSFGFIWIPSRKNKKKDVVYNPHNYEHYKERSPTMYNFMSGDSSSNYEKFKKKEEESDLLRSEKSGIPPVTVASASTVVALADAATDTNLLDSDEKQNFRSHDKDESKEAAGDIEDNLSKDYLEDDDQDTVQKNKKLSDNKFEDNVDSVYLRPPPSNKARPRETKNEEESCGMVCLYYMLQCSDCVVM